MNMASHVLMETWAVVEEMAPYLLFGFGMAGLLSVLISPAFVEAHLGRRGLRQVVKAAALGVPLPLCSCSVLPVSVSLRRHGAGRGATLSFLASTPQTGVDSIMVTHALLGPVVMILRVLTALVSGIIAGMLVELVHVDEGDGGESDACPCCADRAVNGRAKRALRYGFVTLPGEIGRALTVGILLSGLLSALVPENYFADKLTPGLTSMLIMMVAGVPLYVCSSGSVPIALALIRMGVSPGAAFVFLVTGPATNAATAATIWKVLGRRACAVYLVTIMVCALAGGLLLDGWLPSASIGAAVAHEHAGRSMVKLLCAIVLLALLMPGLMPRRRKPASE